MKLSMTATDMDIRAKAPIVMRGEYQKTLVKIREIGYDGVEAHIHDSALLNREEFKQLLQKNNLCLTSIGTGSAYGKDRIFLASENAEIKTQAIERIKNHILTAKDYDACVVIIGLIKGKISDCSSAEVYEKNLIEALKECTAYAAEYGVVLGIEVINHYESDYLNRISEGLELLDKVGSPFLKLHIDTYHMNIEEGCISEAILMAKDKIGHVHIADSDRWYAGHGHYDFKETMDALKAIDYQGALAVESLFYPDGETSARNTFEYIKNMIES